MKCDQKVELGKKLIVLKPRSKKLPQKALTDDDRTMPDFSQTSVFHSISGIKRMPTSGLSHSAIMGARNTIQAFVRGTENIGDLIEDGKTSLIFREVVIEAGQPTIADHRFIIYQKPDSEGQIKIKSRTVDDARTDIDDNEPLIFRQCTFFLCDTKERKPINNSFLSVGIRIATEEKVCFIDCAFVGISYTPGGTKTTGVDFMVFTDCFSKIDLELENCYFVGPKSILYTNFAVRSLIMNQCTFEGMESDCMHITHPGKLLISGCHFINCKNQPLNVKMFDQDNQEKQVKKTSGFGISSKMEYSMVKYT